MRWKSLILFLESEKHEKPQVSGTCLNLDGTATDCSDSLANKVNIHLSSIFLQLCQDLQSKHTNVRPGSHWENAHPTSDAT